MFSRNEFSTAGAALYVMNEVRYSEIINTELAIVLLQFEVLKC